MSIKAAADIVRSQGRYGDSELMHVNPQEIAALQTIAQANGKSLSVNPETGLPEAFDLGAILPTIAGTAIGTMVGMPWLGAAVGGLGTYAATGSLEKGLMAGIGAFGGASLGMGLGAAGAGASTAGTAAGTSGVAGGALGTSIGSTSVGAGTGIGGSMIPTVGQIGSQAAALPATSLAAPLSAAPTSAVLGGAGTGLGPTLQAAQTGAMQGAGALGPTVQAAQAAAPALTPAQNFAQMSVGDKFSAVRSGIGELASNPSATWEAMGKPYGSAAMMAAPLLSGAYSSTDTDTSETEPEGDIRQSDWDPVSRRFVRRPVVSAANYAGPQRSVFAYQEGGAVDTGMQDANRSQIARMYREYLKREPDQAGLDYFANQVNSGAMTMADVQSSLKASPEGSGLRQTGEIESFYRDYMGRQADPAGMQYWQGEMQAGATPEQIQQQIMASPEAAGIRAASQQRVQQFSPLARPQTAPQMGAAPDLSGQSADVNEMYRNLLGRNADPGGLEHWTGAMQQGATSDDIKRAIKTSAEGTQVLGRSMIPNRYEAPVNAPSPGVDAYNQLLQNRANYEYVAMPPPQATRPRTPVEMERIRDQQILGQQMRLQNIQQGAQKVAESGGSAPVSQASAYDRGVANIPNARGGYDIVYENDNRKYETYGQAYAGGHVKKLAQGGIASVPKFQEGGEMESDAFVVPADVVSALGNGSTAAGVDILNQYLGMAMPIEGEGDGLSDDIPVTIEGDQPARIADGEVYIPADVVSMLGEGNADRGAAKLYVMMDKIREAAHGKKKQQKEVNPEQVMPE